MMWKRIALLMLALAMCLSLAACGSGAESGGKETTEESRTKKTDATTAGTPATQKSTTATEPSETTVDTTADTGEAELAAPVMEWWELYNPNGFDTLTAVITNPNDISVDVSYDIVFFKDGAEISRMEYGLTTDMLPGGRALLWANYDIPKSTDADDVRLENITVTKSYYEPIGGRYEYVGTVDGEALFDFTFDRKPTLAMINFLLYNDNNGNGQFDKGEIVVTSTTSLMEQTGRVSFETDVYPFTDYEVFFSAY